MPESFIPVWMSIGEAEQFRATLGELEDSEAGLPERELSLIEGALERERPRSFEQMQVEQRLSEGMGEEVPRIFQRQHVQYLRIDLPLREVKAILVPHTIIAANGTPDQMNAFDEAMTELRAFLRTSIKSTTTQKPQDEERCGGSGKLIRCDCRPSLDGGGWRHEADCSDLVCPGCPDCQPHDEEER